MNEILKAMSARYACRDFKEEMPEDEKLQAIAQAAIQAPSALNIQPWRVIVVKNKELISDMEFEGMSYLAGMEDKSTYNRIMGRGGRLFYGAPCMIIVPIESKHHDSAVLDCGIVCQNITLAATSLQLGSVICGLTRLVLDNSNRAEEFCKRLNFPDGYEFGCSVLIGYPNTAKEPHEPDKEKIIYIE